MLIIFRCTVRHNFEPVRLVPGALFNTQPLVHGSNPSTTNFLAVWRWWMGVDFLAVWRWGWGDVRLPFAVGEVHGEGWFLPVLAASVLSVKLIFAH